MRLPNKVEAIKNVIFIGFIIYNRVVWELKSEILNPLLSMTSKQARCNWSKDCQKSFDTKRLLSGR